MKEEITKEIIILFNKLREIDIELYNKIKIFIEINNKIKKTEVS